MKKYDYSFLKNMKVPTSFLNMTNAIYSLKTIADEKKKEYPDIFTNLQKIAIILSLNVSITFKSGALFLLFIHQ